MNIFNKRENSEKNFNLWLNNILKGSIPENIKSLAFKVKISNNNVQISLIGLSEFSINFDSINNFVNISDKIFNWNTNLEYKERIIKELIEKYLKDGKYSYEIKKYDYISMILSNGVVDILYLNNNIKNNLNECEKIEFSKFLDINEIIDEYKLEELVDYSIGYDNNIHLMFIKNNKYFIMTLFVDWNKYKIIKKEIVETNIEVDRSFYRRDHCPKYLLLRAIKNNYLLVSPRLENQESTTEPNALLVSKDGNVINSMCLGDDIESKVITTNGGKIIVAYGDEGIYGSNQLSVAGMNIFADDGKLLYQNKKYILDCTNIYISDKANSLYFYDSEGNIIKSNLDKELLEEDKKIVNDAFYNYTDFLINKNNENGLLFLLPIYKFNELKYAIKCKIDEDSKRIVQESFLMVTNKENLKIVSLNIRGSKLITLSDDNILYGYEFN